MFCRLVRLTFSVLLAITPATTLTVIAFPLAAGAPQPITSQAIPTTLIAGSGANLAGNAAAQVTAPILTVSVDPSSNSVRPGQEFVYTIQYRNDGDAPATGLRITETYPSQVTFVSAIPAPDVDNNVWLTDTLAVGGLSHLIQVTVRVNTPVADGTLMNNQVTVSSNEIAPFTVTASTPVNAPTLQLTKSANPAAPTANGLLTYTLQYTNSGTSYASNVVITDAVPLNTVFQSCTSGCITNSNIVTWTPGPVAQQTSGTLALTVRVNNNLPNGTLLTNTAGMTSTEMATASATLANTVSSTPNLGLSKSDGVSSVAAGDVLTYQLAYTNTGTAPAQNVVITDRIPANVSFVGCGACIAMGSNVYSFTLGTVNAAQGGVFTLSVRVNSPLSAGVRTITNTAYIRTSTSGDNAANNSAQDADSISTVPDLDVTAAYDASTPYPGKTITYTLRYTNTSLMNTTGVVISTTRAPYVSVNPTGWVFSGGNDTYTVGNLAASQSGTIAYVVVLTSTFTPATKAFNNTFLIHDGGPGGLPVASQNVTTTIGVPDLLIESVKAPWPILPNQKFTATLAIRNAGTGRACNPARPGCGTFYVDAFIDPVTPPLSYPFVRYGQKYAIVPPIPAGLTATIAITNIVFTATQQPILYFKVDNYDCSTACLPPGSRGGVVPEYNENNNVAGLLRYIVFLPLVWKSQP